MKNIQTAWGVEKMPDMRQLDIQVSTKKRTLANKKHNKKHRQQQKSNTYHNNKRKTN